MLLVGGRGVPLTEDKGNQMNKETTSGSVLLDFAVTFATLEDWQKELVTFVVAASASSICPDQLRDELRGAPVPVGVRPVSAVSKVCSILDWNDGRRLGCLGEHAGNLLGCLVGAVAVLEEIEKDELEELEEEEL